MAVTLALSEAWLRNWTRGGVTYPIGQQVQVHLPAGKLLVYYESRVAVPLPENGTLRVLDSDRERLKVRALDGSMDYRLMFTGWSGRAMWEVDVPAAGTYSMVCHNHNVLADKDIPADDRVVMLRQPESFKEVKTVRVFILVTGATITMTAVIVLYALHSLTLRKRRSAASASPVAA